jgi:hypothetical protein
MTRLLDAMADIMVTFLLVAFAVTGMTLAAAVAGPVAVAGLGRRARVSNQVR